MDEAAYKTGYKRPPLAHQFRPGQSGNPKGRPKGARSLPEEVRAVLGRKITVTENGRKSRIGIVEAALRRLIERAVSKGDLRAIRDVLALADLHGADPGACVLAADDEALLASALQRLSQEVTHDKS